MARHGLFHIYILILFLLLFFSLKCCYAGSVGIEPMVMELNGKPGEVLKGNYRITNPNDYSMTVETELRNWGGFVQNRDIKIEDWLKLDSKSISLNSKETKELNCTIEIPKDVVGELMGMVYFKASTAPGSNIRMSLGTSIYVVINGTEKIDLDLKSVTINLFDPEKSQVYGYARERNPFYLTQVVIENKGNVHVRPRIRSYIKDYKTKKVLHKINFEYGMPIFGGRESGFRGDLYIEKMKPEVYFLDTVVTFDKMDYVLKKRVKFAVDEYGIPKIINIY